MNNLDQFYTKPETARKCWSAALPVFKRLHGDAFYIEPSAGDGVFYDLLPKSRRIGFDLEPRHNEVIKCDFLKTTYKQDNAVIIGNPPFGKRGKLAVAFMNKAFAMADTVALIVPVIFKKYFIHKQITERARLIRTVPLNHCAFTTPKGDCFINTEFQIWTTRKSGHKDKRLRTPPPTSHPHFALYQYNNTKGALKMFDHPFDFAVPCQGYQDYRRRETDPDDCEKHKQWMLIHSFDKKVKERLYRLDYDKLSKKNTTTIPGFRKGDLIQEYSLHE